MRIGQEGVCGERARGYVCEGIEPEGVCVR